MNRSMILIGILIALALMGSSLVIRDALLSTRAQQRYVQVKAGSQAYVLDVKTGEAWLLDGEKKIPVKEIPDAKSTKETKPANPGKE